MKSRAKAERFMQHLEPLQGALEMYCRRLVRDPGALMDVLQSAIANAYRDFHLYAEGTNFRAWIFRYVHLELLNANRKHARHAHEQLPDSLSSEDAWELVFNEPSFLALLDDPEAVLDRCDAALAAAMRELSEQERSTFLLHVIGEFKYREIAEVLQVPIGTVMSSIARCRLRLRQRLLEFGKERGLLTPEEK